MKFTLSQLPNYDSVIHLSVKGVAPFFYATYPVEYSLFVYELPLVLGSNGVFVAVFSPYNCEKEAFQDESEAFQDESEAFQDESEIDLEGSKASF